MELSPREREILNLIAQGRSYKEIALALCICVATVDFHLTNARKKLNARNSCQAANTMINHRLYSG